MKMFKVVEFLVTGLYVGKSKWAPGTMGTILAVPMAYYAARTGLIFYLIFTIIFIFVSIFLCQIYELHVKHHDLPEVVIDEVVGYFVAFLWLPITWKSMLASFILFRFFDILKPFPISHIDQKIKGGLGVVCDDLAAGLVSNIILQFIFVKFL